ncbi:hypothetical protein NDU88_004580 [Pleurodeles waltl]|uniref:Uncharacterized protein n=1 Tax=Pleurodeles waltl TaxID=8319 RepID=A0AAV7WSA1_PLEWA|nr:hypothetical protein NDU88_004580 [Pleurodeles waltl]
MCCPRRPPNTGGRRHRCTLSPCGRPATRSKPGSLLSSAARGPLLSLGQRSPRIRRLGVEGRRRPGRWRSCLAGRGHRLPRPRGLTPQRAMSAPSAPSPAPRISGGHLRGPGGVASAPMGRSGRGRHAGSRASRAAAGAWSTPLAAKPLGTVHGGQGVRGDNQC